MIIAGRVLDVWLENVGSTVTEDYLTGETQLTIVSAADFDEGGGQVEIAGDVYDYSDIIVEDGYDTITITPGLLQDIVLGDEVNISPLVQQKVAKVQQADFSEEDYDSNSDIEASIAPGLADTFEIGERDDVIGEWVQCDDESGEWVIVKCYGREGKTRGEDIVGPIPVEWLSDGNAPSASPTPVVAPFAIGGISWSVTKVPNTDPVRFRVYADTVDPPTIDAAHMVYDGASLGGSFAAINGVGLLPADPAVAPSPIYVAVIEYDADGDAPLSATSAPATPRRAGTPEISADFVYAGTLQANQIEAGTFEADLALVGRLSVGNYTVVDGDTGAITIYADAEHTQPLIQLDPAGSVFRGQIIADDISVLNGLILQGTASHIAQNAGITLDNAINDPGNAPTLSLVPATSAWPGNPTGYSTRGIHWDGTNWIRLIAKSDGFTKVQTINSSGGLVSTVTLDPTPDGHIYRNSIVRVGSFWYTMGLADDGEWRVYEYNTSGDYLNDFGVAINNSLTEGHRPCVGTDGTNLLVASCFVGDLFVEDYTTGGVWAGHTYSLSGGAPAGHQIYVAKSSFDFGASRIVVGSGSVVHSYTYSGSALTEQTAENFTLPSDASGGGVAWNGSHFYSTHGSAILNKYPDYYPGASENAYVSYRDTDGTDHTMDSPHASIPMVARRYIQATLPPAPSGASVPAVYAALGTSDPADTALLLRSETVTGRNILIDPSVAGGADLDPDSNTFGAGTPAWVKSQAGGLEMYGDGSGKWPLLEVPFCKAIKTTAQTLTVAGTSYAVTAYNSFEGDNDNDFWTYASGVWEMDQDGLLTIEIFATFQPKSDAAYRRIAIMKNGSAYRTASVPALNSGSSASMLHYTETIDVAAGDDISFNASAATASTDLQSLVVTLTRKGVKAP